MASGVDLTIQGMRSVGNGLDSLGQGLDRRREYNAQQDAANAKRQAAEDAATARTEMSAELSPLATAAQDPNFDQATFIQMSNTMREKIVQSGDMDLLRSLESIERAAKENRKEVTDAAKTVKSDAKQAGRDAKVAEDLAFKGRAEIRTIKDKHNDLSKNTNIRREAFTQIQTVADADPSAAGDLSLIFSYMKILDPPSTVREGEQALAEQARGVPDGIRNLYNKLLTGERLTPEQRADFATKSEDVYRSALKGQKDTDAATLQELQEIAGSDPAKLDLYKKKVFSRTADEELKDLDTKAEARKKKKEEKARKEKEEPLSAGSEGKPPLRTYGKKAGDVIFEKNKAAFMPLVEQTNKDRAAAGLQPMSDSEINAQIIKSLNESGVVIDPTLP